MTCEYCDEKDESMLVMRSSVVNGKVETVNICTSCLWKQLLDDKSEDEKQLSDKDSNNGKIPTKFATTNS